MARLWKKRLLVFGLTPVMALAAVACSGGGDDDPFRIGVMESLTGPGETYGTVASQAKQMAVDEINAAGGVDGRTLELVVEDSKCGAQDAIAAYKKLTQVEGLKIILGTSCSGAMLGVAPLAEADGTILFSGLASNPDIAKAGDYIFRTQISDIQVGIATGNTLWADGIPARWRPSQSRPTTRRASGARRGAIRGARRHGGGRGAVPAGGYRLQVAADQADRGDPDALHLAPQSEFSAGTIIKQARELGFEGPIYAETVSVGTTAIAGDAATGMKAITADLDPDNEKAQEVLANFRARYNYVTLPWHLGSAYDDVYIAAECLKQTKDDQDADGFRDCMYEITWSGAIATTTASTPTARSWGCRG